MNNVENNTAAWSSKSYIQNLIDGRVRCTIFTANGFQNRDTLIIAQDEEAIEVRVGNSAKTQLMFKRAISTIDPRDASAPAGFSARSESASRSNSNARSNFGAGKLYGNYPNFGDSVSKGFL